MTKSLRGGKVFLDWSQNTGAKTTISPYSLRGRDRPYVAAPRTWEEIEDGAEEGLGQLEMDDVLARVDEDGDIFGDLLGRPADPARQTKPAAPERRRRSALMGCPEKVPRSPGAKPLGRSTNGCPRGYASRAYPPEYGR